MRFIFYTFPIILVCFCNKTPEKLLEKAKEKLAEENTSEALAYLREAFDTALPREYFFTSPKEKYSLLRVSYPPEKILLVPEKNRKRVKVYGPKEKFNKELSLPEAVEDATFSANGNYLVFLLRKKNTCLLQAYSFLENKKFFIRWEGDCCFRPAILENGQVPIFEDGKIWFYELNTGEKMAIGEKPDPPTAKLGACGAFYVSPSEELYFTLGRAGLYKWYQVYTNKFKLLRKDLAFGQVFFNQRGNAVITGGAGELQLIYQEGANSSTIKLPFLEHLVFLNYDHFFYRQGYHFYEFKNGKKKELPYWVRDAAIVEKEKLLLLTASNRLIWYLGDPPKVALAIYQKGSELDEVY